MTKGDRGVGLAGSGEGPERGDDAKSLNEITKLGRKEMRNGRDS